MNNTQQSKEDQILLSSMVDKFRQASEMYMPTSSHFLDMRQRTLVQNQWRNLGKGQSDIRLQFFGGYDEAERVVACYLPDYAGMESLKLSVIRASAPSRGRQLTHRDYLGSLIGLGIKREFIGDILVDNNSADIIILDDIKEFLLTNYDKAGRTTLELETVPIDELHLPDLKSKIIKDTVASLRLDNVISSAFGTSRSKAAEAIKRGVVFVNSTQVMKVDSSVSEGDKLVLRGKGKAYVRKVGNRTRKDRIYIYIERFL